MSDAVQAFRTISWLIFKWLFIATGVLLLVMGICVAGYFAYVWYTYDRHVAKVMPIIFLDRCETPDYPILVVFHNKSTRTIERVGFNLVAKVKGRSTNIAQYESLYSDFIVPPGEGYGTCFRLPKFSEQVADFKKLEWSVGSAIYTFSP